MVQIRIQGRRGQGDASGAETLSVAAFLEGRDALAGKAEVTVHA
jgi:Pyruvate/2-oxoacid:ferredoxin oxidoreductase gamma subunit